VTPSVLFRRRLLGWSLLALLAAVGGFWLLRLDLSTHISTDVLDLVPTGEGSPELTLVRSLASDAESRTMLIALDGPHGAPATAEAAGSSPIPSDATRPSIRWQPSVTPPAGTPLGRSCLRTD
jgi:hypothetical protein